VVWRAGQVPATNPPTATASQQPAANPPTATASQQLLEQVAEMAANKASAACQQKFDEAMVAHNEQQVAFQEQVRQLLASAPTAQAPQLPAPPQQPQIQYNMHPAQLGNQPHSAHAWMQQQRLLGAGMYMGFQQATQQLHCTAADPTQLFSMGPPMVCPPGFPPGFPPSSR